MIILGIETSCDETAVALIDASGSFGTDFRCNVLGNALISQVTAHQQFGGVFPNLAKREHGRNLVPVLMEVLRQSKMLTANTATIPDQTFEKIRNILARETELLAFTTDFLNAYQKPNIDCIAVTTGPGLEPALWTGIGIASALAAAWNVPLVPVNHMEGHIVMALLRDDDREQKTVTSKQPAQNPVHCSLFTVHFPLLSLLISGGHTQLVLSREWMRYELVGQTRDDAVGEAFDKIARLLGLPYPGGPEISRLATEARNSPQSTERIDTLPRPMINSGDFDFSFSGLKTAVMRLVESRKPMTDDLRKKIAREFEDAVAEVLVSKTHRAIEEFGVRTLIISGGVSANTHIREQFTSFLQNTDTQVLFPPPQFSTDNALMIALAGYFRALKNEYADPGALRANGSWRLAELA